MTLTRSEQEHLQQRHDRLVNAVGKMRGYQKEFFKNGMNKSSLENAKRYERIVDGLIAEEVKINKSKQREIF